MCLKKCVYFISKNWQNSWKCSSSDFLLTFIFLIQNRILAKILILLKALGNSRNLMSKNSGNLKNSY